MSRPTISQYFRAAAVPNVDSCARIAVALDLPVRAVLDAASLRETRPGAPALEPEDILTKVRPELKRAEAVALALSRRPELLEHWLAIGEAIARARKPTASAVARSDSQ